MTQLTDTRPSSLEVAPCPMCGESAFDVWMEDGKPTRYVRCRQCRTVYASPRSSFAQRYAWLDASFGVGEFAHTNARIRQSALLQEAQIIKRLVASGRLLDVGCDLGDFFASFPSPTWERFGVELSPSAARYAAAQYDATVSPGSLLNAGFPNAWFDVITLIDVLYYLDNPTSEFCEIRRILKPGGVLAVEVTGQAFQLTRSRGILCWLMERNWTRLHTDSAYLLWPTPYALLHFLQRLDFSIIDQRVIPSPHQPNRIRQTANTVYSRLMEAITHPWPGMLTFAPKYLVLARRSEDASSQ